MLKAKVRASKLIDYYGAEKYFGIPLTLREIVNFSQNNWKKFHGIHMTRGWRILKFREENENE